MNEISAEFQDKHRVKGTEQKLISELIPVFRNYSLFGHTLDQRQRDKWLKIAILNDLTNIFAVKPISN